jgi:HAD superfamily hydrolase (TIGR01490 family)
VTMPGIDFFDVDHTITRRSSGARFIALAMQRGLLPLRLLLLFPFYSLQYKLGIYRPKETAEGFPYLAGIARASLEEIARESFESRLRSDVYEGAAALIAERRRAGRRVALATSSVDIIVEPLARHLGVDDVLATVLEFSSGVCTGRIVGKPMFRAEKMAGVLAFIAAAGEKPADCGFYSDSIYDLPLLETIGRPVAVNPDFRLRRIALRRGWPVIDLA